MEGLLELLNGTLEREPWKAEASCRGLPRNWFFASNEAREEELRGIQVCGICPVSQQCLDYAIRTRCAFGIFGGKTTTQRKRLRWKRKKAS